MELHISPGYFILCFAILAEYSCMYYIDWNWPWCNFPPTFFEAVYSNIASLSPLLPVTPRLLSTLLGRQVFSSPLPLLGCHILMSARLCSFCQQSFQVISENFLFAPKAAAKRFLNAGLLGIRLSRLWGSLHRSLLSWWPSYYDDPNSENCEMKGCF